MIYTDGVHVISDQNLTELHSYCRSIGIKRCWFHSGSRWPHYDVPKKKQVLIAAAPGIKVVTSRRIVEILKKIQEIR